MAETSILATVTGDFFQPVRLHYRVANQNRLLAAFKKLRCLDEDPPRRRWVWLYEHEARGLRFKHSYNQLPRHLHPIVIGSIFLRTKGTMLLDLRSCERAILAVPFFDRHISRKIARVTEAEVVNKLFSTDNPQLAPDDLFDHQPSTAVDSEAELRKTAELTAPVQDPQEKLRIATEYMESQAKCPLPEIERFPVHFYEDGIGGFQSALRMRQVVALQHWLGNTEYTLFDVIRSITSSMQSG
jgi:hypothetical protein